MTYRCNARCHFFLHLGIRTAAEADFETIQRNLNDLRRLGVKYVNFTGGEPLLRSDVGQIYAEAKKGVLHQHDDRTRFFIPKARKFRGWWTS